MQALKGLLVAASLSAVFTPSAHASLQLATAPASASLGAFTVKLDGNAGLTITQGSRTQWASLPAQSWIVSGTQALAISEKRGSFKWTENVQTRCENQTVDTFSANSDRIIVRGTLSGSAACSTAYTLIFTRPQAGHLSFDISFANPAINLAALRYASAPDERFHGFGEQFSVLDLKGRQVPILSQEGGVGRGQLPITTLVNLGSPGAGGNALTTYYAVPHYITSSNTSLFLENKDFSVFDLTRPDRVEVRLFTGRMRGQLLAGTSMLELITRFSEYTGRMRPLPDWANQGAIMGLQGGSTKVAGVLTELERRGTPLAGLWLQDWVGKRKTSLGSQLWWNWELDRDRYPDWDSLVNRIERAGGKVLCYVNPFLVDATPKGNVRRNLYQEAVDQGYLVKHPDGSVYKVTNTDFDAGMIDLTSPAAVAWMKDVIKTQVMGEGRCEGWMHDFAEALPFDARMADGRTGAQYHNQYPVDWAKLAREAITEAGKGDSVVFFNRSGSTDTPRYSTLVWQGDQLVTWDPYDGLQSALIATLTSGFSGISLTHSDIGGYTNASVGNAGFNREQELLLRWMEMSAFTTAFRTHEGLRPELNSQAYSNTTTWDQFDRFARVYKALAFYRSELFAEAANKGWPVVRHPMLHYPDDAELAMLKDEFMLGSEFLVAPIINKRLYNNDWKKVYFPDAATTTWVNPFTGETFGKEGTTPNPALLQLLNPARGHWHWVHAPIGKPAVFYRKGSAAGARFASNLSDLGVK